MTYFTDGKTETIKNLPKIIQLSKLHNWVFSLIFLDFKTYVLSYYTTFYVKTFQISLLGAFIFERPSLVFDQVHSLPSSLLWNTFLKRWGKS